MSESRPVDLVERHRRLSLRVAREKSPRNLASALDVGGMMARASGTRWKVENTTYYMGPVFYGERELLHPSNLI